MRERVVYYVYEGEVEDGADIQGTPGVVRPWYEEHVEHRGTLFREKKYLKGRSP